MTNLEVGFEPGKVQAYSLLVEVSVPPDFKTRIFEYRGVVSP